MLFPFLLFLRKTPLMECATLEPHSFVTESNPGASSFANSRNVVELGHGKWVETNYNRLTIILLLNLPLVSSNNFRYAIGSKDGFPSINSLIIGRNRTDKNFSIEKSVLTSLLDTLYFAVDCLLRRRRLSRKLKITNGAVAPGLFQHCVWILDTFYI